MRPVPGQGSNPEVPGLEPPPSLRPLIPHSRGPLPFGLSTPSPELISPEELEPSILTNLPRVNGAVTPRSICCPELPPPSRTLQDKCPSGLQAFQSGQTSSRLLDLGVQGKPLGEIAGGESTHPEGIASPLYMSRCTFSALTAWASGFVLRQLVSSFAPSSDTCNALATWEGQHPQLFAGVLLGGVHVVD